MSKGLIRVLRLRNVVLLLVAVSVVKIFEYAIVPPQSFANLSSNLKHFPISDSSTATLTATSSGLLTATLTETPTAMPVIRPFEDLSAALSSSPIQSIPAPLKSYNYKQLVKPLEGTYKALHILARVLPHRDPHGVVDVFYWHPWVAMRCRNDPYLVDRVKELHAPVLQRLRSVLAFLTVLVIAVRRSHGTDALTGLVVLVDVSDGTVLFPEGELPFPILTFSAPSRVAGYVPIPDADFLNNGNFWSRAAERKWVDFYFTNANANLSHPSRVHDAVSFDDPRAFHESDTVAPLAQRCPRHDILSLLSRPLGDFRYGGNHSCGIYPHTSRGRNFMTSIVARDSRLPSGLRLPKILWRGSLTGERRLSFPIPRRRLLDFSEQLRRNGSFSIDAKTTGFQYEGDSSEIPWSHRSRVESPMNQLIYRGLVDIDGNGNAWSSFLWKMATNASVVFKVESEHFYQWFYPRLRPWHHFAPVVSNLSDLQMNQNRVFHNPDLFARIAIKSSRFVDRLSIFGEILRFESTIMNLSNSYRDSSRKNGSSSWTPPSEQWVRVLPGNFRRQWPAVKYLVPFVKDCHPQVRCCDAKPNVCEFMCCRVAHTDYDEDDSNFRCADLFSV